MNNLKILVIEDEQELLEKYQILIEEEIADINLKNIKF